MVDIKSFTNWGDQRGRQGALSIQKNEKITRTVPILKSNSTYFPFHFFVLWWILQILPMGEGCQGGRQAALSVQKNEKIAKTVPILKSNFQ